MSSLILIHIRAVISDLTTDLGHFLSSLASYLRHLGTSCHGVLTDMRASLRLLAMPTAAGSTQGLKPAPLALLPPIPLYRRLFRTHRKFLKNEMRLIGDEYIKHEFREHQRIENPMHIVRFSILFLVLSHSYRLMEEAN